jgi:hypothetical protein
MVSGSGCAHTPEFPAIPEKVTMISIFDESDPQAQRLEQMKNEFLIAQQRRRERTPAAAPRPDHTDDRPLLAGPAAGRLTEIAAVRP